ncbi:hypothetical protein H5T87_08925 [bacterium]|nr:hypothetical protein [bacterium]
MRSKLVILVICVIFSLLSSGALSQTRAYPSETTYIPPGEVIKESYFWAGDTIDFNGHALKDIVLVGKNVRIYGVIEGDVIAFAQKVMIVGEVKGNVRAAGETVDIEGKVGRSVSLAGKYVEVGKSANIGWDVIAGAQRLYVDGRVGGDVKGSASEAILAGEVDGNVNLKTDELSVLPTVHIKGNLFYSAEREAVIPKEAKVDGKVVYKPKSEVPPKPLPAGFPFAVKLLILLGFLLTGVIMVLLFPRHMREISIDMVERPWAKLGWGFLVLIATPIGALLIALSVIGLPLTFILFGLYLIALYLATPLVGVALGAKLLQLLKKKMYPNLYASMAVGTIIFFLLGQIPLIGWFINLIGICWALGGMQGATTRRIKAGRLGPEA